MKLTEAQRNVLELAEVKLRNDRHLQSHGFIEDGWFYPQHTSRGAIDFAARWQTCRSLCGLGLFEYRTIRYSWRKDGTLRAVNEYRISQAGLEYLRSKQC